MHILFRWFSFLSVHNIEADELHVLHLGVSQYLLGSVLWLLTYKMLDSTPIDNFEYIWEQLLIEYRKTAGGTEYTSLSIASFVNPDKHDTTYPRLKGRGCEVKSLVGPLCDIWARVKKKSYFVSQQDR